MKIVKLVLGMLILARIASHLVPSPPPTRDVAPPADPTPVIEVLPPVGALRATYDRDPRAIRSRETDALWVCRALIQEGRTIEAVDLEGSLDHPPEHPDAWLTLRVDGALREGRTDVARELLQEAARSGSLSIGNASRLALLLARVDLEAARQVMTRVETAAPDRIDTRLVASWFWERTGSVTRAIGALTDLMKAHPRDGVVIDRTAAFLTRWGDPRRALELWGNLGPRRTLEMDRDLAFFRRVVIGSAETGPDTGTEPPADPLARAIRDLPPGRYWSTDLGHVVTTHGWHPDTTPRIFWLRLIDHLSAGETAAAGALLSRATTLRHDFLGLHRGMARLVSWELEGDLTGSGRIPREADAPRGTASSPLCRLEAAAMKPVPTPAPAGTGGPPTGVTPRALLESVGWTAAAAAMPLEEDLRP